MGNLLDRKKVILAKVESTYGVDPLPILALDALLINGSANPEYNGNSLTRDFLKSNLSPNPTVQGRKLINFNFDVELKSAPNSKSGAAAAAPEYDALLRACSRQRILTAETTAGAGDGNIRYKPTSSNFESCTIYTYLDGLLHIITGCYGSYSYNMNAGEFGVLSFAMQGNYNIPTDTAFPAQTVTQVSDLQVATPSGANATITSAGSNLPVIANGAYFILKGFVTNLQNNGLWQATGIGTAASVTATKVDTAVVVAETRAGSVTTNPIGTEDNTPKIVENTALTIGGFTPCYTNFTFDAGVQIGEALDGNSPNGFKGLNITDDRTANGSITLEAELRATKDFWTELQNSANVPITAQLGTAGQQGVAISIPRAIYQSMPYANVAGKLGHTINFVAAGSAGDDEDTLTFT